MRSGSLGVPPGKMGERLTAAGAGVPLGATGAGVGVIGVLGATGEGEGTGVGRGGAVLGGSVQPGELGPVGAGAPPLDFFPDFFPLFFPDLLSLRFFPDLEEELLPPPDEPPPPLLPQAVVPTPPPLVPDDFFPLFFPDLERWRSSTIAEAAAVEVFASAPPRTFCRTCLLSLLSADRR